MKKFLALVLAAILVLSLSAVVFADDLIVDNVGDYPSNTQPSTDVERVEVPFTKIVDKNGGRDPGKETFVFEILQYGIGGMADKITVESNTIQTNGKGVYKDNLVFSGPAGALAEGFIVREKKGTADGWTYSDEIWCAMPEREDGKWQFYKVTVVHGENGDYYDYDYEHPYNNMVFTNNYYMAGETSVIHIPVPVEKNPDTGAAVYTGAALFLAAALR